MKLRGIDFGHVLNASGARNITGKGYWTHRFLRYVGLNFDDSTFVAKTVTREKNKGNMPLKADGETPQETFPKCVVVKLFKGVVLNAVGLSNPGIKVVLEAGKWQKRTEPFFISFMPIADSPEGRKAEMRSFVKILLQHLPDFDASIGLKLNISCPNVDLNPDEIVTESSDLLDIGGELGIPLVPKFNALLPIQAGVDITQHPSCDAICMSNSIPWGRLPEEIPWKKIFGTDISPLTTRGFAQEGGLSGKYVFPIVRDWIERARKEGIRKPIIACGGISTPKHIHHLLYAGASAIELGSVSILRPWRVQNLIQYTNRLYRRMMI